jgi:hypothetical protein
MSLRDRPSGSQARVRQVGRRQVSWRQARAARAQLAADDLSRQEKRRLRSMSRAREIAVRRRNLRYRHIAIVVAGAAAVMAVAAVAFALGPAIGAARGQGTSGTFVVGSRMCSKGCTWVGTFESAGGEMVPGVAYEGSLPAGAGPGSSIPAIYPGGYRAVFAPHGSHVWLADLLLVMLFGGAMAVALWISPIRLSRHRGSAHTRGARPA